MLALVAVLVWPIWAGLARRFLTDVAGQLASCYLLPAMGLLLALRCGAIDLSVWSSAALGGVVAAVMINSGFAAGPAFLTGIAAGGLLGTFNAALVALARLPSVIVTLVSALAVMWGLQSTFDARAVMVPDGAFEDWHLTEVIADSGSSDGGQPQRRASQPPEPTPATETITLPLIQTRMLLVVAVYGLTMLVMLAGNVAARANHHVSRRASLLAAMCASGALAAAGGAFWLLDHGAAPIPTRPVGDLRVPAAAILAGALFFTGQGRALLAGLCLPAAMLLTTIWRQGVCNLHVHGYAVQVILLAGMTFVVHRGMARSVSPRRPGRPVAGAGTALAVAGLLVLAGSAAAEGYAARRLLHMAGGAVWLAGALVIFVAGILARCPRSQDG